jgi:hypothetical protein
MIQGKPGRDGLDRSAETGLVPRAGDTGSRRRGPF